MSPRRFRWVVVLGLLAVGYAIRTRPVSWVDLPAASAPTTAPGPASPPAQKPEPPRAERGRTLDGVVVGVSDGDTVTVLDSSKSQFKIRMTGIDAPESHQAFGQAAKQKLADLVFGKNVKVEVHGTDRYKRTLGKVLVDGIDVNLEMIKAGLAWHYVHYAKDQAPEDARAYGEAESVARAANRGLWADMKRVAPWDFRRGVRPE